MTDEMTGKANSSPLVSFKIISLICFFHCSPYPLTSLGSSINGGEGQAKPDANRQGEGQTSGTPLTFSTCRKVLKLKEHVKYLNKTFFIRLTAIHANELMDISHENREDAELIPNTV